MIVLLIEIALKSLDIFMINGKRKSRFEEILMGFMEQYDAGVKKNVKIKRRYDEMMQKLRSKEDGNGSDKK